MYCGVIALHRIYHPRIMLLQSVAEEIDKLQRTEQIKLLYSLSTFR